MADVVAAKAEASAVRVEANDAVAVARAEAEKAVEDEFASGFFQGYSDLKRRVAEDHPEWDLSAYSGVDSDYWEAEAEGGGTPVEAGTGSAEVRDATRETEEVGGQEAWKTQVISNSEKDVLIVDNEPAA